MTPGRWRTADSVRGAFRSTSYTTALTGGPAAAGFLNLDAGRDYRRLN